MLAQDIQLDRAAPGALALDPPAVVIRVLFQDDGRVQVWVRLDVLGDDGAELGHVVHGAEVGGVEGAEEARVVVRRDAEEEGGAVGGKGEFGRVEVLLFPGKGEGRGFGGATWLAFGG